MTEYKCFVCRKAVAAKDCICEDCRFDVEHEDRVEANGKPYPHYDTRDEADA